MVSLPFSLSSGDEGPFPPKGELEGIAIGPSGDPSVGLVLTDFYVLTLFVSKSKVDVDFFFDTKTTRGSTKRRH